MAKPKAKVTSKVRFEVEAPGAKEVLLAGDFTDWERKAKKMTRSREEAHLFSAGVDLPPGTYQYKFIVDGEWRQDPRAESCANDKGSRNSICRVG